MQHNSDHHAPFKAELIAALSEIDRQVAIDWTQFDNRTFLTCYAISACWSWDALIRIRGVSDEVQVSEEPESWDRVIRYVNRLRDTKVNFDALATLCIAGFDFSSVILLAFIVLQFQRARRELVRRLGAVQVGKQVVFWQDQVSNFRVEDLLSVVQPPPAITVKGKKRYISDPFPDAFDAKEKAEMQQSLNIEAALEHYKRLKLDVELKSETVPFSPIANTLSAPLAWEKAFPRIMQQEIDANLTELVPILDRGMEEAPFKSFDLYRTEARREQHWKIQKGEFSEVNDSEDSEDELDETDSLTRQIELTSQIHYDELEREKLGSDPSISIDKMKTLSDQLDAIEKQSPKRTRPKVRPSIKMYIETGSIKKTTEKQLVDNKTLSKWIVKLDLGPVKPVSTPRKRK